MATNQEMHSQTYINVHNILTKLLPALPGKVWDTPVRRGGKNVSALQELADAKTVGYQNADTLDAVNQKLDQIITLLKETP